MSGEDSVEQLMTVLGVPRERAMLALQKTKGSVPAAVDWHYANAVESRDVCTSDASPTCWAGHELKQYSPDKDAIKCDLCAEMIVPPCIAFGCRTCNWDACAACQKVSVVSKEATLSGYWGQTSGADVSTIRQDGNQVQVTNTKQEWSPVSGTVSKNTLSLFGLTGTISADHNTVQFSNGIAWYRVGTNTPEQVATGDGAVQKAIEESIQDQGPMAHQGTEEIRREGLPMGLKNVGNTCFVNSFLQSYFHLPEFREIVFACEVDDKEAPGQEFVLELQRLFAMMALSIRKCVDPTTLLRTIRNNEGEPFQIGPQQDATEFNLLFLDNLERALLSRPEQLAKLRSLFYGKTMKVYSMNEEDGTPAEVRAPDEQSQVIVPVKPSLYSALDAYTQAAPVPLFKTPKGFGTTAMETTWFSAVPPVLTFHLNRVGFDVAQGGQIKRNDRVEISKVIYLDRYMMANADAVQAIAQQKEELRLQLEAAKTRLTEVQEVEGVPLKNAYSAILAALDTPDDMEDTDQAAVAKDILLKRLKRVTTRISDLQKQAATLEDSIGKLYNGLRQYPYRLHAIVVHSGSASSGHYWAYVYNSPLGTWFKLNDARVTVASEEEAFKDAQSNFSHTCAYTLMYVDARRDASIFASPGLDVGVSAIGTPRPFGQTAMRELIPHNIASAVEADTAAILSSIPRSEGVGAVLHKHPLHHVEANADFACDACKHSISGTGHRCNECDYSLCESCYGAVPVSPAPVDNEFPAMSLELPKTDCPHVTNLLEPRALVGLDTCVCSHDLCGSSSANWLCLSCGVTRCGRGVNMHMKAHGVASEHHVVMSLSALNFWCYECDSYVRSAHLSKYKDAVKGLLPSPSPKPKPCVTPRKELAPTSSEGTDSDAQVGGVSSSNMLFGVAGMVVGAALLGVVLRVKAAAT